MRKFSPIKIKVYLPSNESVVALTKAVADVHAAAIVSIIRAIDCSAEMKVKILDKLQNIK